MSSTDRFPTYDMMMGMHVDVHLRLPHLAGYFSS